MSVQTSCHSKKKVETHRNVLRWETLTEWDSLERRCLRETDGVARHLILELTVILVRYE